MGKDYPVTEIFLAVNGNNWRRFHLGNSETEHWKLLVKHWAFCGRQAGRL